jgi:hypothetical protein
MLPACLPSCNSNSSNSCNFGNNSSGNLLLSILDSVCRCHVSNEVLSTGRIAGGLISFILPVTFTITFRMRNMKNLNQKCHNVFVHEIFKVNWSICDSYNPPNNSSHFRVVS